MLNLKMNKMKKISLITLVLLLSFSSVFGQKKNIVNAALYLKTSQKSKGDDIVKNIMDAKKYALGAISLMISTIGKPRNCRKLWANLVTKGPCS